MCDVRSAAKIALFVSFILTGCSTEQGVTATDVVPFTQAAATGEAPPSHCSKAKELVYFSNLTAPSAVEIFDGTQQSPKMCGIIPKQHGPYGLFVDAQENLWVTEIFSHQIEEFPKGSAQPSLTLDDPDSAVPGDVAVDDRTGTVYVSDMAEAGGQGPGGIEVYEKGQTQPTRFLQDSRVEEYDWIALDNEGNLYVVVMLAPNKYSVLKWRGGKGNAEDLMLDIGEIGGIRITSTGGLAVCTFSDLPGLYWCGQVAPHSRTYTPYFESSGALCFDKGESHAFIPGDIAPVYAWPGPQQQYVNIFYPTTGGDGVAVDPPDPPGPPYQPD